MISYTKHVLETNLSQGLTCFETLFFVTPIYLLNERFGKHRRSTLNYQQLTDPTPVSLHFNQAGHSINDVILIPLELIRSNRDAVRKGTHHLL